MPKGEPVRLAFQLVKSMGDGIELDTDANVDGDPGFVIRYGEATTFKEFIGALRDFGSALYIVPKPALQRSGASKRARGRKK